MTDSPRKQALMKENAAMSANLHRLAGTVAHNGCVCSCHRGSGIIHFVACCSPSPAPADQMELYEKLASELDIDWVQGLFGSQATYSSGAEFIADVARRLSALDGAIPAPAAKLRGYQERVAAAHHALFHDDPTDIAERVARFFEEAVETCQAFGLTHYDADKLLNYTYDRPVGEPAKEIGAALLTLASLCVVAGYDLSACGEADLEKLQRSETIARIRAKRSTRHGRGALPGIDPAAASEGSADV